MNPIVLGDLVSLFLSLTVFLLLALFAPLLAEDVNVPILPIFSLAAVVAGTELEVFND